MLVITGGWGVGSGRENKQGCCPLGLTFSSERQAPIEVLWDRASGGLGPFKAHMPGALGHKRRI